MRKPNPDVTALPEAAIERALERFETPFYIYDEAKVRAKCRALVRAFGSRFARFEPLYAVKANTNPEVLRIVYSEGFGGDCSSEAEAWITRELGASGMYTGNYTTEAEYRFVKDSGLLINLDDVSMLPMVERNGAPEFLSFRINPGIARGGMKSLVFAGEDAKFGVPAEQAVEAYRGAQRLGVRRFGIHMMTGSNVLDEGYFELTASKLLDIAGEIRRQLGIEFEFERVNIGGGFGVPYRPEEPSLDLERLASGVRRAIDEGCARHGLREPSLMIEPGRWVLADCGWLVATVHVVKNARKTFAGVDAGMNDLPRPSIYDAYHHITVLGKPPGAPLAPVSVVGRLCENNDQFAKDRMLPPIEVGDRVVIHNAGAHCYAMSHNYNNRLRCAEVLLAEDGTLRQIRRAETFEDLFKTVELP